MVRVPSASNEAAGVGGADDDAVAADGSPVLPAYGGACLSSLSPALLGRNGEDPQWIPQDALRARQVVLLVLDGVGWEILQSRRDRAPTLATGQGGPITSVVPSTTATALTSISTGKTPAEHGIVGYRMRISRGAAGDGAGGDGPGEVFNVLRWRSESGDLRKNLPAREVQPFEAFAATGPPAVTKGEFAATGFTAAHLGGTRIVGWHVPSSLVVHVKGLLAHGESFVYAYYDGIDKVAHQFGLGDFFDQELRTVDRLVSDLVEVLPPEAALVVTSDHGQVEVGGATRLPGAEILEAVEMLSGEGRFRWLHARKGARSDVVEAAESLYGHEAWIRTREQIEDEGWFGGSLRPEIARRLGDVAIVARGPVAFLDPADTGETRLMARHGSLTAAEMFVPLLVWPSS